MPVVDLKEIESAINDRANSFENEEKMECDIHSII